MKNRVCTRLVISLAGLLASMGMMLNISAYPAVAGAGLPAAASLASTHYDELASPTVCALPHGRIGRSSPAIGDLTGDGVKEIVIGGSDGYVYALRPDCTAVPGWPKQANDYFVPPVVQQQSATQAVESTPTLADIDGDGRLEIIVTVGWMPQYHQNGGIIVFEDDGAVKAGWPKITRDINGAGNPPWHRDGYSDGAFSTPAVGDVDGDGEPDIVHGAFDKCIYAWHANGTPLAGWWDDLNNRPARCLPDTVWSSPALTDLDGDGTLDIVIGTDTHPDYAGGSVWALKGDNTVLWTVYTTQIEQSSPAVGDINGDGFPEIVIGTGTYYPQGYKGISDGHKVYAFDRFGNNLPGWPRATDGNMYASPSLADLDGDGKLEILIGCGAETDFDPASAPCKKMYAWHYDGTPVAGYPAAIKRANGWPDGQLPTGMPYGPMLADYDDDGIIDVFLVEVGAWGISIFPYNNPGAVDISRRTDNTLQAAPAIENLYNDNRLYMVVGGADSTGTRGVVYIWQLSGVTTGKRPWPMFRQRVSRTGHYPLPPHLSVSPASIYVMHQLGSSTNEYATLYIQNIGEGAFEWESDDSPPAHVAFTPSSGIVTTHSQVRVTISTTGYTAGAHHLGDIVIEGATEDDPIAGSPVTIPINLYVGEVHRVLLPIAEK